MRALLTAIFLFIAGLTGAVIAWEHELDEWLNPHLFKARSGVDGAGESLSPLALAARVEAADPRVRVTYLPLAVVYLGVVCDAAYRSSHRKALRVRL